ncbi:hypothetical protein AOLI_G00016150 [Acnodon oligacanthus]
MSVAEEINNFLKTLMVDKGTAYRFLDRQNGNIITEDSVNMLGEGLKMAKYLKNWTCSTNQPEGLQERLEGV